MIRLQIKGFIAHSVLSTRKRTRTHYTQHTELDCGSLRILNTCHGYSGITSHSSSSPQSSCAHQITGVVVWPMPVSLPRPMDLNRLTNLNRRSMQNYHSITMVYCPYYYRSWGYVFVCHSTLIAPACPWAHLVHSCDQRSRNGLFIWPISTQLPPSRFHHHRSVQYSCAVCPCGWWWTEPPPSPDRQCEPLAIQTFPRCRMELLSGGWMLFLYTQDSQQTYCSIHLRKNRMK